MSYIAVGAVSKSQITTVNQVIQYAEGGYTVAMDKGWNAAAELYMETARAANEGIPVYQLITMLDAADREADRARGGPLRSTTSGKTIYDQLAPPRTKSWKEYLPYAVGGLALFLFFTKRRK